MQKNSVIYYSAKEMPLRRFFVHIFLLRAAPTNQPGAALAFIFFSVKCR